MKRDSDYIHFRPYGALARPFKVGPQPRVLVRRSQGAYALLAAVVIGLGLAVRAPWMPVPHDFAKAAGDALWALMVFLLFALVRPRLRTSRLALAALLFSYAIECTQLYHAPWIDNLRSYWLGAIILGTTFNWPDFASYTLGVALGVGLDFALPRKWERV